MWWHFAFDFFDWRSFIVAYIGTIVRTEVMSERFTCWEPFATRTFNDFVRGLKDGSGFSNDSVDAYKYLPFILVHYLFHIGEDFLIGYIIFFDVVW